MTLGQHTVTVTPAAGGAAVDMSCWVDQVAIRHGRDDPGSQPEASSCTVDLATELGPWPTAVDIGALVKVITDIYVPEPGPSTLLATNLAPNPSLETNITSWGVLRGTAAQLTDGGVSGTARMRYTADGTTGSNYVYTPPTSARMPVTAGTQYTGSAYVGNLALSRAWRIVHVYYDAAGAAISTLGGAYVTVPAGASYTRVTHTTTAPVGAVSALMRVACQTSPMPAGETADIDAAMFTEGSAALPYFDGDTPDTSELVYAWTGTPHASTSTKTELGWVPTPYPFTRFVGRITDMALGWDEAGEDTPDAGVGQVVAVGALADTARRVVGDVPFPQELDGARVSRIMSLAGMPMDPLYSDPGTVQVLPRDIDSQAALSVAQEVAVSASGVLWQTRDNLVRYADSDHRRGIPVSLELDACDVLVTPSWRRSLEGLINKVSLGYGPEPEGGEQPRFLGQDDASIARLGVYDYSLTTVLAAAGDAQAMGQLLLVRNSSPVWVMASLPVDMKSLDDDRTMALLGLDMHSLVSLTGLPTLGSAPTSAQLWVEGWNETLAWGVHDIELVVSGYCRTAPPPRWDDIGPDRTWDGTAISWNASACMGPPQDYGRWTDVPASVRWNTATETWDTWNGDS